MIVAKFTEAELNRALTRNSRALIRGKKPSEHPTAILLGGQSGAGKTTIHRIKQEAYQGNIIVIDGDSFCPQHPNFSAL